MIRLAVLTAFSVLFAFEASASYKYAYVPKAVFPTVYGLLYSRRDKCAAGEKVPYPGQQHGACVSCSRGVYMIDETVKKASCFLCPDGTLTALNDGLPVCLSLYPVVNGKALTPKGTPVGKDELRRMASTLGADYKVAGSAEKTEKEEGKTFRNKKPLRNVCPSAYPDDPKAERQTEICKRLALQNDFLCPYVEQNADGQWVCRACPKNAPYKGENGGCFTCPYGEEMVSLTDGRSVCASEAPKPEKKPTVKTNKAKAKPAKKKAAHAKRKKG